MSQSGMCVLFCHIQLQYFFFVEMSTERWTHVAKWLQESQDVVWLETWSLLPPKTSHKRGSCLAMSVLLSSQNTPDSNLTAYKPISSCALKFAVSTESEAISRKQ